MFIPVSVEELSPGSLCDLMRGKKLSLSFLSRPICSRKPGRGKSTGTAWSGRSWAGPDGAAVGGLLNADEESRWEGVQGRTRISGIEECWNPARNSKWEQLLANRAWRLNTGDLWRKLWRYFTAKSDFIQQFYQVFLNDDLKCSIRAPSIRFFKVIVKCITTWHTTATILILKYIHVFCQFNASSNHTGVIVRVKGLKTQLFPTCR